MSCVAEAKAVIQKMTNVAINGDTETPPAAIPSGEGDGNTATRVAKATAIRSCIVTVHHLLVLRMSTKGLQRGLMNHGRYRSPVNRATSPFAIPILFSMMTEILLTTT